MAAAGTVAPIPSTNAYAIMLHSLDEHAGLASGTLSLYAGDARYDIPFRDILSVPMEQLAEASPIVVRFESAVKITDAMVASLDGPGGGPCVPFVVGTGLGAGLRKSASSAFLERARNVQPLEAPKAVILPRPTCSEPDRPAALKRGAPPPQLSPEDRHLAEQRLNGMEAQTDVGVILDNQGRLVTTSILKTSGDVNLDGTAIYAARHSVFVPQRFRCEDVGGSYRFVVQYVI